MPVGGAPPIPLRPRRSAACRDIRDRASFTGMYGKCCVRAFGVVWLCAAVPGACGSDEEPAPGAQFDDAAGMQKAKCDAKSPELQTGMNGTSATDPATQTTVRVVSADKQPPNKDFNTWQISVTDGAGEPIPNAHIGWACAWMSVHGHGSTPQAINPLGPGEFELKNQNFAMYGPWEVHLWVDPTGAGPEYLPQNGTLVRGGKECEPTNGAPLAANISINFCVPEKIGEDQ